MKLYKLKQVDIDLIQAALTSFSRSASISQEYLSTFGGAAAELADIEFDTAKLSAVLSKSTGYIKISDEQFARYANETGFDVSTEDFDEVIDNNTSPKPISDEAKAKVQSLWWKAHDDYLKLRNEQDQGIWDDLSEEHKRMAREQQYKECQVWNEIMSLTRNTLDNINE